MNQLIADMAPPHSGAGTTEIPEETKEEKRQRILRENRLTCMKAVAQCAVVGAEQRVARDCNLSVEQTAQLLNGDDVVARQEHRARRRSIEAPVSRRVMEAAQVQIPELSLVPEVLTPAVPLSPDFAAAVEEISASLHLAVAS